jgi:hypothetical protein
MATLHDKNRKIELLLRPHRITEYESPTWILTQLEFRQQGKSLFSTTINMTLDDLSELAANLQDVALGRLNEFILESTDGDLVIDVRPASSIGDFFVGTWVGEPYELMKGYRIVAQGKDLASFSQELGRDKTILPS